MGSDKNREVKLLFIQRTPAANASVMAFSAQLTCRLLANRRLVTYTRQLGTGNLLQHAATNQTRSSFQEPRAANRRTGTPTAKEPPRECPYTLRAASERVKRFGRLLASSAGTQARWKKVDPRENPPTSGIVIHDSQHAKIRERPHWESGPFGGGLSYDRRCRPDVPLLNFRWRHLGEPKLGRLPPGTSGLPPGTSCSPALTRRVSLLQLQLFHASPSTFVNVLKFKKNRSVCVGARPWVLREHAHLGEPGSIPGGDRSGIFPRGNHARRCRWSAGGSQHAVVKSRPDLSIPLHVNTSELEEVGCGNAIAGRHTKHSRTPAELRTLQTTTLGEACLHAMATNVSKAYAAIGHSEALMFGDVIMDTSYSRAARGNRKITVALHETGHIVTGCLRSNPVNKIDQPPDIARRTAAEIEKNKPENDHNYNFGHNLTPGEHRENATGYHLPCMTRKTLNRLRTSVSRCKQNSRNATKLRRIRPNSKMVAYEGSRLWEKDAAYEYDTTLVEFLQHEYFKMFDFLKRARSGELKNFLVAATVFFTRLPVCAGGEDESRADHNIGPWSPHSGRTRRKKKKKKIALEGHAFGLDATDVEERRFRLDSTQDATGRVLLVPYCSLVSGRNAFTFPWLRGGYWLLLPGASSAYSNSELQCETVSPDFVIIGFSGLPATMVTNLKTHSRQNAYSEHTEMQFQRKSPDCSMLSGEAQLPLTSTLMTTARTGHPLRNPPIDRRRVKPGGGGAEAGAVALWHRQPLRESHPLGRSTNIQPSELPVDHPLLISHCTLAGRWRGGRGDLVCKTSPLLALPFLSQRSGGGERRPETRVWEQLSTGRGAEILEPPPRARGPALPPPSAQLPRLAINWRARNALRGPGSQEKAVLQPPPGHSLGYYVGVAIDRSLVRYIDTSHAMRYLPKSLILWSTHKTRRKQKMRDVCRNALQRRLRGRFTMGNVYLKNVYVPERMKHSRRVKYELSVRRTIPGSDRKLVIPSRGCLRMEAGKVFVHGLRLSFRTLRCLPYALFAVEGDQSARLRGINRRVFEACRTTTTTSYSKRRTWGRGLAGNERYPRDLTSEHCPLMNAIFPTSAETMHPQTIIRPHRVSPFSPDANPSNITLKTEPGPICKENIGPMIQLSSGHADGSTLDVFVCEHVSGVHVQQVRCQLLCSTVLPLRPNNGLLFLMPLLVVLALVFGIQFRMLKTADTSEKQQNPSHRKSYTRSNKNTFVLIEFSCRRLFQTNPIVSEASFNWQSRHTLAGKYGCSVRFLRVPDVAPAFLPSRRCAAAKHGDLLPAALFRGVCVYLRIQGQEARERYGRYLITRLMPHRSYTQGVQCFRPGPVECKSDLHNTDKFETVDRQLSNVVNKTPGATSRQNLPLARSPKRLAAWSRASFCARVRSGGESGGELTSRACAPVSPRTLQGGRHGMVYTRIPQQQVSPVVMRVRPPWRPVYAKLRAQNF
ncbi:hypothetical protein PR048_025969 [Dryococelus australis]|uniref:Uncharacterized protein n=1 Tax=Dryococelus australis TaxID=614101 RepID=A0ABQ9GK21_9NEOP|nr:hypothetical protein PR048_025969 [Dryococelus australis]